MARRKPKIEHRGQVDRGGNLVRQDFRWRGKCQTVKGWIGTKKGGLNFFRSGFEGWVQPGRYTWKGQGVGLTPESFDFEAKNYFENIVYLIHGCGRLIHCVCIASCGMAKANVDKSLTTKPTPNGVNHNRHHGSEIYLRVVSPLTSRDLSQSTGLLRRANAHVEAQPKMADKSFHIGIK